MEISAPVDREKTVAMPDMKLPKNEVPKPPFTRSTYQNSPNPVETKAPKRIGCTKTVCARRIPQRMPVSAGAMLLGIRSSRMGRWVMASAAAKTARTSTITKKNRTNARKSWAERMQTRPTR